MLRSQMQMKAPQTKRSKPESKQYCNRRHVARQTTAYYIITSQPLGVLWQLLRVE